MGQGELIDSMRRLKEVMDELNTLYQQYLSLYQDYLSKKGALLYYILDTHSVASFSISDPYLDDIIETDDYYYVLVADKLRKYDKQGNLLAEASVTLTQGSITILDNYIYAIADSRYIVKFSPDDLSMIKSYDYGSANLELISSDGTYLYIKRGDDNTGIYRVTLHDDTNTATTAKVVDVDHTITKDFDFIGSNYIVTASDKIRICSMDGKTLSYYELTQTPDGIYIYYDSDNNKYYLWVSTNVQTGSAYANKYELKASYKPIIDKAMIYGSQEMPFKQTSDGKLVVDTELHVDKADVSIADIEALIYGKDSSGNWQVLKTDDNNRLKVQLDNIPNPSNLDIALSNVKTSIESSVPRKVYGSPDDGTTWVPIKTTSDGKLLAQLG